MNTNSPFNDPFQILEEVNQWKTVYSKLKKTKKGYEHDQRLLNSIAAFETFCLEYIDDIKNINNGAEAGTEAPQELPQKWLRNRINYTLFEYWEPILKAAEQHQVGHYRDLLENGYGGLGKYQDKIYDLLKFNLNDQVVLYFDKVGKYKRYPFGGIYLIGIPLLDAYEQDWMAMPHELGHHIFWNSQVSNSFDTNPASQSPQSALNAELIEWSTFFDQEIEKHLPVLSGENSKERRSIRALLEAWAEEIFADIVGVKIAKNEFAESAWDKIARNIETPDELFKSDRDHPMPYLLPRIRFTALGRQNDESRWTKIFPDFTRPQIDTLQASLDNFVMSINTKLTDLQVTKVEEGKTIMKHIKGAIERHHPHTPSTKKEKKDLVKVLLNLSVQEEGEGWKCTQCGTINAWWRITCEGCGKFRWS